MAGLNPSSFTSLKLEGRTYSGHEIKKMAEELLPDAPTWQADFYAVVLQWLDHKPTVEITTSGTTGVPKVMDIDKEQMVKSAMMTGTALGLSAGDRALLCLPVQYIGGTMMVVRAFVLGLDLVVRKPVANPAAYFEQPYDFTALTSMQVWEILREYQGATKLEQAGKVIIGGGAIPAGLESQLAQLSNQVWHTYGMTETLSHIALRRVNGKAASEWFTPLPGVEVEQAEEGRLKVFAPGITPHPILTNDVAEIHENGRFRILGRYDFIINSGGVKCHPEILEDNFRKEIPQPFFVAGWPDEKLGERIILMVEQKNPSPGLVRHLQNHPLPASLRKLRPRALVVVPRFFRTRNGKLRRKDTLQHYLAHPDEIRWESLT